MAIVLFLVKVFFITFSGAMQPGPVTATTIQQGLKNKWAGTMIVLGHAIVEFPLMILIVMGMDRIFQLQSSRIIIGLLGGAVLFYMCIGMLREATLKQGTQAEGINAKPLRAGMVLSVTNPYFLLWWTTVGLGLAIEARDLGMWAFVLFCFTHWFVDGLWLQLLSYASFKGSHLLGRNGERVIMSVCGILIGLFGIKFISDAIRMLLS